MEGIGPTQCLGTQSGSQAGTSSDPDWDTGRDPGMLGEVRYHRPHHIKHRAHSLTQFDKHKSERSSFIASYRIASPFFITSFFIEPVGGSSLFYSGP